MNDQQAVTPFVSLDEAVLRIHRKWERILEAEQKTQSARIECGMRLLELRARIEAGEAGKIAWWAWYETKFTRDRRDAEKVMAIASAADPAAAHEAEKAATRQRMQALRARTGAQSQCAPEQGTVYFATPCQPRRRRVVVVENAEVLPPEPSQQDIEDKIVELFRQLHRQAQTRCAIKLRNILQGRE